MKLLGIIIKFLNKIIMALENKKLSSYDDLASANVDTTTKLVVLTGTTKVNNNLPVTNFIEDSLTSISTVKPLSAKQGKVLKTAVDLKETIANVTSGLATKAPTTNPTGGINNYAPKESPTFTGSVTVPTGTNYSHAVNFGQLGKKIDYIHLSSIGYTPLSAPAIGDYYYNIGGQLVLTWNGSLWTGLTNDKMESLLYIKPGLDGELYKWDRVNFLTRIADNSFLVRSAGPVFSSVQTFADNAAAAVLPTGTVYKTPTGVLMIKY